jgi:hypothetical protein
MSKVHCIAYASNHFSERVKNYTSEIIDFNRFDSFKVYSEQDLDPYFLIEYKDIMKLPRGGGYWAWKPQIIKQYLEKINNDDILFYTDIGCSFNNTKESQQMFDQYLDIINQNNFLRFALSYNELEYTNSSVINFFAKKYKLNFAKLANSRQLMASIMAFKKNDITNNFLSELFNCLKQDPQLITDAYNDVDRLPLFKDHRHDQSLFSVLYKSLGYNIVLEDHTWSPNFNNCINVPILTTRARL